MKLRYYLFIITWVWCIHVAAQDSNRVIKNFPAGTKLKANIRYGRDTVAKHKLDIYWSKLAKPNSPLLVWIHGGGWRTGDQCNDMSYMKNTGIYPGEWFVLASIDYRWSKSIQMAADRPGL